MGTGVLSWSQEQRLSRDWGRKDTNTDSAGRAPAAAVAVEVQRMRADWLLVAGGCVLAGCRIQRPIPGVDIELHSCPLADLGPGETLFLPILR